MRLLMIDNYDSFTYNLVQYLGELGAEVDVVRNDVESDAERTVIAPHLASCVGPPSWRLRVVLSGWVEEVFAPLRRMGICS